LATTVGVNNASYKQCVAKHLTLPDQAITIGRGGRRQSTPTFFVGQQMLAGATRRRRGDRGRAGEGRAREKARA